MKNYQTIQKKNWTGRSDSIEKERIHQYIECLSLLSSSSKINSPGISFLGFCSDEGIRRNKGQLGARKGPDSIRNSLKNLCLPEDWNITLFDYGNISCLEHNLEQSQSDLAEAVYSILKTKSLPIILGGGHETAWGHFQGISRFLPKSKKIALINIDAHLDLRPLNKNKQGSSGTPFLQIAKLCK